MKSSKLPPGATWQCLAGLLGLACTAASAAPVSLEALLRPPVSRDLAAFGLSVALSDDGRTALVGARDESRNFGGLDGAAYVFVREGDSWSPGQMLSGPDNDVGDRLGSSVALSADGTRALVGAISDECGLDEPSYVPGCGAAFVYVRSGSSWVPEARLTASRPEREAFFGSVVALSADGSTALVGAPFDRCGGSPCVSAHVFVRHGGTWSEQARLLPIDPMTGIDELGVSVALSAEGNTALLGAHRTDCSAGPACGAVYAFDRTGGVWVWWDRLSSPDPESYKLFGSAVALSGDGNQALVGAPFANCEGGEDCGAAYLFVRVSGGWAWTHRLTPSDPVRYAQFGTSVALSRDGSAALIGAPGVSCPTGGSACGAVYRFVPQGSMWIQDARVSAPSPPARAFGFSVALTDLGSTLLVGAPGADCPPPFPCQGVGCPSYTGCGAAYVFGDGLILAIPTLTGSGLVLLIVLLAALAVFRLRRQGLPVRP